MNWELPPRPAELVENRLINAIVDREFPINARLPPERELAQRLGVTRPTMREALQRLARDGWIEIHHGKSTRVRDYWHEGNLAVLGAIARHQDHVPPDFVPSLLHVRELLAPAYARLAVKRAARNLAEFLEDYQNLIDTPDVFAKADWELHRYLTIESGNPSKPTEHFDYFLYGHFMKFIQRGAVRVESSEGNRLISDVAFCNPDRSLVLVLVNSDSKERSVSIRCKDRTAAARLVGRSVATFVWAQP